MASSESEGESFEVSEILQQRKRGRNTEYLVRWDGYDSDEDSWESAKNVKHATGALARFEAKGKGIVSKSTASSQKGATSSSRTTTTTVTTRTSRSGGTQSLGSFSQDEDEDDTPKVSRRRVFEEYTSFTSNKGGSKDTSVKSCFLSLNRFDLPIVILVACLLFIALTFVVEKK